MTTEDRKFLDLDHVCDQIISQDDRAMFNEAIRCYQIGSHRAAVILAWSTTAACLSRRIDDLASEGDGTAQEANKILKECEGTVAYEGKLIKQSKECGLIDDYEQKSLTFARDTRSKCAHPTGVVPSAEAVRHILYICSQTVLCRESYRGMSFIKQFVQEKLDNRYLFSNKNNVSDTCKHYFGKVPERIQPQFAVLCANKIRNGYTQHWKENTILFFKELLSHSTPELANKITQKFQAVETFDKDLFSVLVGLDNRDIIWDTHTRNQAKAHLRDSLNAGIVDSYMFQSYANLCSIEEFDENDKALFKKRFLPFSKHLSEHTLVQEKRRLELLSLLVDSIKDDEFRQQTLKGAKFLVSTELFSQKGKEIEQIVENLIESDWREDTINELLSSCSNWSDSLKATFLKNSEDFLMKCTEDFPDDVIFLFEVARSLLSDKPSLLPHQFEDTIKELIDGDISINWFEEEGAAWGNFVGQVDLIRLQHGTHLPVLLDLTLPGPDELDDPDELEEFEEIDD